MASLAPLLTASPMVQIHVACASLALLLLPVLFLRKRRDHWHKRAGYIWVTAMAFCALSSFGISGLKMIGPFSPIHILSVLTLIGLWQAVRCAIRKEIAAHQRIMRSLAYWALGVAGALTLLPGRTFSQMLFGQDHTAVLAIVVLLALIAAGAKLRAPQRYLNPRIPFDGNL